MKFQKLKTLVSLLILICFLCLNISPILAAQVKMTEDDVTGGIPEEALPTFKIELPSQNSTTATVTNAEEKDENFIVKGFRMLVVAIGDLLFKFLKPMGADVDTVIYNKSPSGTESKFKLDFSAESKSPFSFMGRQLYVIFKSFALFIMFIILLTIGAKFQMSATSRNKVDLKETVNNYLVSFVMIFWLPAVLNFVLQGLNVCVSALNPAFISGLGGFSAQVEEGKTLGDAAVYLGTAMLSFYFTAVYITRALHITMFYFMFPIMSTHMNGNKFKESFNTYISDLISTLSIQIFDAALFLGLTVLFSKSGALNSIEDAGFWKIVIAACIIPLRTTARKMLGFSKNSFGMDMLGMAGVMGAMGLARGFASGAKSLVSGVGGGISTYSQIGKLNRDSYAPESSSEVGYNSHTLSAPSSIHASSTGIPTATSASFSTSPDITPYMNKPYGHVDMGGGISRPITDKDEAVRRLLVHGSKQMFGSVGQAVGGVTGASIGAIAGMPFGLGGAVLGANVGGAVGGAAGEIAGNVMGHGIGYIPFSNGSATINQNQNQQITDQANASVDSQANLATIMNSGTVVPVNNVTYSNSNGDFSNGRIGIPDTSSANGGMSQSAQDLFSHYINNIPPDRYADIEANAIKTAESYADPLSKQYGSDKLGKLYDGIKTSSIQQGAVEYAIDQIKTNHNVDASAFESLNNDIKRQMIGNIKNQVDNFFKDNDSININEV